MSSLQVRMKLQQVEAMSHVSDIRSYLYSERHKKIVSFTKKQVCGILYETHVIGNNDN